MTPSDDPRDDSQDDSRDDSRDDEVWQDIVNRYGDKALPDDLPEVGSEVATGAGAPDASPERETWNPVPWEDEGRFVPPTPDPIPMPPAPRLAAWLGLFGAPAVFLFFLVANWSLPSWASTLLIVWFVAGFAFLVATMGSGPRDPGDDGAVV